MESEEADAWRRIRAYVPVMPEHAFFVGPTAALIAGVPLPSGLHDELHVGVLDPRTLPRRPGIRGRRFSVAETRRWAGMRLADPATTWASLAPYLGEYDMVAASDYLLRIPRSPGGLVQLTRTRAFASRADLEQILAANRWRGGPLLRRALNRARTGASSRPETWTRLIIVDGGLPEPELDLDIFDESGDFVACADLAYPHLRLAIEYDGAVHRERDRFLHDIDRTTRLHEAGWQDLHLASPHVFGDRAEGLRRVIAARRRSAMLRDLPRTGFGDLSH
ncbi:hypothetical protein [Microbacterium suaedae]|uniref:hypothetical protein n=1 Tax=Microbacterium suaedae TaxID=2067813 RepID=UPI0013A64065|nr:hypothetical protein [Microbacterium suaedae]